MRTAIITGASSGMGKEFVLQLDSAGEYDEFWIVARREERLKELSDAVSTPCRIFALDLEKREALDHVETALKEKKNDIYLCVNSAGFGKNGDFHELDRTEQLAMIDLNCRAVVDLTHLLIPFMPKGSRFINISSIAGLSPLGAFAMYGATKSFLTSFSIGLATDIKELGIGMTLVTPGSVDTEFQKRSRGKDGRKKKMFAQKSKAEDVVRHALKDAKHNRLYSVHGFTAKFAYIISKVLTPSYGASLAYNKIYPKNK